ncbi:hypothetical protein FH5_04297 [Priestia endophytica]|nr:hypothetical protein FH5_04297 [Priestia endophytica]
MASPQYIDGRKTGVISSICIKRKRFTKRISIKGEHGESARS